LAGSRAPLFPYTTLFRSGGQGRVLDQVESLVDEWRDGDAHRLGQDHEAIALEVGERHGVRRLALAPRHGLDRTADDLGHVTRRRSEEHTTELQSRENIVC